MTRAGRLYALPTLAHPTGASGGSAWPTCRAANPGSRPNLKGGKILAEEAKKAANWGYLKSSPSGPDYARAGRENSGGDDVATQAAKAANWPGVRATDADRGGRGDLIQATRGNQNKHFKAWPTVWASEWKGCGPKGSKSQKHMLERRYLGASVLEETPSGPSATDPNSTNGNRPGLWQTPAVGQFAKRRQKGQTERKELLLPGQAGGQLNPAWVETLQGLPIGWTGLDALEMESSLSNWRRLSLNCLGA